MDRAVSGVKGLAAEGRDIVDQTGDEGELPRHQFSNDDGVQLMAREHDLAVAATLKVARTIQLATQRVDVSELCVQESLQAISVSIKQRQTPPLEQFANLDLAI
jgi:hypothetical protein